MKSKKVWEDKYEWSADISCGDHSISQPIPMQRRPGSFPGNETGGLLSPKSTENLGLKLVNYILDDNSPSMKELENRMKNAKINYNQNEGKITSPVLNDMHSSNGDANSHQLHKMHHHLHQQASPVASSAVANRAADSSNDAFNMPMHQQTHAKQTTHHQQHTHHVNTHQVHQQQHTNHNQNQQVQKQANQHMPNSVSSFDQNSNSYESSNLNIDPTPFDYGGAQLMQPQQQQLNPSIDSPMSNPYELMRNTLPSQFLMQQAPISSYNAAPPYFQEPFLSIPAPYLQPAYYGIHNMMYHQIQQQQMGTSPGTLPQQHPTSILKAQNGRPITPPHQTQQTPHPQAPLQMNQPEQQNQPVNSYAPSNFSYYPNTFTTYDPNAAAAMMSNTRSMNSGVRLISPMLINSAGNQSLLSFAL